MVFENFIDLNKHRYFKKFKPRTCKKFELKRHDDKKQDYDQNFRCVHVD